MSNNLLSELMAQTWAMEPRNLEAFLGDVECAQGMLAVEGMVPTEDTQGSKPALNVRDGVAHIAIDGPMLKRVSSVLKMFGVRATSTVDVGDDIDRALADESVKSIMLDVDSPGGIVSGVSELADKIAAADRVKPVSAHATDMMASAALWVASQARTISANPSCMAGSLGVYNVMVDESGAAAKQGSKVHVIASSPLKGAGVRGSVITDEQLADSKRLVDGYASMFVDAVSRGRRMDAAPLATGQVWLAADAVSRGLVDHVCSEAQAHQVAAMSPAARPAIVAQTAEPPICNRDVAGSTPANGSNLVVDMIKTTEATSAKDQTTSPQAGASEDNMAEKIEAGAVNPVAIDTKETDALKAQVIELQGAARKSLMDKYASRINPADVKAVEEYGAFCGSDMGKFEAHLLARPEITRPVAVSSNAPASEVAVAAAPTEADRKLMAVLRIEDPARQKYLEALAEQVDHINSDKKLTLKDGKVMTLQAFQKMLGYVAVLAICLFSFNANASALAGARQTTCKGAGAVAKVLMTASNTIYAGGLVMIDSAGTAVAAGAAASNNGVVGVALETKTSGGSGDYWISVQDRVVCKFAGDTLQQDDVGKIVYSDDDQTVDETTAANDAVAGLLVEYVSASVGWVLVDKAISMGRVIATADPLSMTGDLTLGGGVGALEFTDTASSLLVRANDTTALLIGPAAQPGLITIDSGTATETVVINGTNAQKAFDVAVGTSAFVENVTFGAGIGVTGAITATTTITSSSATSLGWHIASGANTSCETTCTSAAVIGFDGTTPVDHDNAAADICICAGAN
jgi:signal peptide peptidase SppA